MSDLTTAENIMSQLTPKQKQRLNDIHGRARLELAHFGIHGSERWLRFSSRNIVDRQRVKTRAISSGGTFVCLQCSILRRL